MVALLKTLSSASLLGLATSRDWCTKHEAIKIWNQTNKPHMLPKRWLDGWFDGWVTAFTQDARGNRYYAGQIEDPPGVFVSQVVRTNQRSDHASYTIIWGEPASPVRALAASKDGLSLFIVFWKSEDGLLECPTVTTVPQRRCEQIVANPDPEASPFNFRGMVYDDAQRVLYLSVRAENIVVHLEKDDNGKWLYLGRAAGNADLEPDLTGLNDPGSLRIYEGDLYILESANRIVPWAPGADQARAERYALNTVVAPTALSVYGGYIYYMDTVGAAVYRRDISNPSKDKELVAGGCGKGTGANQLQGNVYTHLFVDAFGTLIIEEFGRVVAWNVN